MSLLQEYVHSGQNIDSLIQVSVLSMVSLLYLNSMNCCSNTGHEERES